MPVVCCAVTFSAISPILRSTLLTKMEMSFIFYFDLIASLFGSPSKRLSEHEEEKGFLHVFTIYEWPSMFNYAVKRREEMVHTLL